MRGNRRNRAASSRQHVAANLKVRLVVFSRIKIDNRATVADAVELLQNRILIVHRFNLFRVIVQLQIAILTRDQQMMEIVQDEARKFPDCAFGRRNGREKSEIDGIK